MTSQECGGKAIFPPLLCIFFIIKKIASSTVVRIDKQGCSGYSQSIEEVTQKDLDA